MSDFISLYTAFSGLTAAQAGINTTSHNIANAATEGVTRQRIDLTSRMPFHQRFGLTGQGVDVQQITRVRVAGLSSHRRRQRHLDAARPGHHSVLPVLSALPDSQHHVQRKPVQPGMQRAARDPRGRAY